MKQCVDKFVLITPARNEEDFIEQTCNAIIEQTVLPLKWIIVNDGSDDRTVEIVERLKTGHAFIELLNLERAGDRNFGGKALAFNAGLQTATSYDYDFIGNLDADITLAPDYYEHIIKEFRKDSRLGIAGGMVSTTIDGKFVSQNVALDSVAGAVQLFRRSCFEETGGYMPLPLGGIDAAAEIMARKNGWTVRTFPELRVLEHRRTGSATASPLMSRVKEGKRLYSLGYSGLFFLLRCVYRVNEHPMIIGSVVAFFSYLLALFTKRPILLPPDTVEFLRKEQHAKIMDTVNKRISLIKRRLK